MGHVKMRRGAAVAADESIPMGGDGIPHRRTLINNQYEYLLLAVFDEFRHGYGQLHAALQQFAETKIAALETKVDVNHQRFHQDLQAAEQNRKELLDKVANQNQTGLDKAERMLREALDKAEHNLQIALTAAEARINDKFEAQKGVTDKTELVVNTRLQKLDQFTEKIQGERALYVQKGELDTLMKSLRSEELKPLNRAVDWSHGAAVVAGALVPAIGWLLWLLYHSLLNGGAIR